MASPLTYNGTGGFLENQITSGQTREGFLDLGVDTSLGNLSGGGQSGKKLQGLMGGSKGKGSFSTADLVNKGVDTLVDTLGGDSSKGWAEALSGAAGGVTGFFTGDYGGMIDSGGDVFGGIADYTKEDSKVGDVLGALESSSHAVGNYMQGDIKGGAQWTGEMMRDTGSLFKEGSKVGSQLATLGDTSDQIIQGFGVDPYTDEEEIYDPNKNPHTLSTNSPMTYKKQLKPIIGTLAPSSSALQYRSALKMMGLSGVNTLTQY